ncbi:Retrovirus-related Pol polyprotein from transposon 17.6 [Trichinella spiralis]|uniref:Retrovirus-related Pol polyprotein from transposon 17.6 n=1 Tax=Trichinella spiralis TaxID=6334 RepID=A0A0V1B906_TRISP|nr:Retrovirus-related Pol polyprotein from transposon 17.6 [Trichinella spiralis]
MTDTSAAIKQECCFYENIIEESCSPWRAQALVVTSDNHKKRMVIEYSQTINRFTLLHVYPLGKINDMVQAISKYHFFSTVDLKSAYCQIPINARDRPYTAFEAGGRLYQFKRIPFGVTNGVPCFQRVMDNILPVEKLKDTFVYVDNVMICGMNQEEHDENLNRFREVAEKYNLTLNNDKSSFRRVLGMFAAYSQWIPRFSEKIHALARCTKYPLPQPAVYAFKAMTNDIVNSVVTAIDDELPFTVETDASDHAIAATLSQLGKPVSFFSRMLSNSEQRHSSVEKEAYRIVEAIRKWRHYLLGHHFHLITDQRSVAFMFNNKQAGKAKSNKIGPLPSTSSNRYLLTVVDEYSRFPFAFPCPGISIQTVSKYLTQLLYLFGMPAYIHTDRGSSFMSNDLKTYLHSISVLTSRTTAHNPQGNGQAERLTDVRETTGSLRHLAPAGGNYEDKKADKPDANDVAPENSESEEDTAIKEEHQKTPPRRSTRIRRAPQRLQDYVQY